MTKRRSRKEKNKEAEEKNGGVGVDVQRDDVRQRDVEFDDENSRSEPHETKKRKSEKRISSSSKKSKKAEPVSEDEESEEEKKEEEEDDDTQYEVEEIMDEKVMKGVRHYLIRWKGYDEDGDTWEPETTLDCAELIKKFKEKSNEENESPKKGKKGKTAEDDAEGKPSKKGKRTNDKKVENGKKGKKQEKSSKKSKPKNLPDVDWESDDEFEVDRILDVYFKKNGKREFLVSWKGYPSNQDSWEPEENLDCTNLIERYMEKVHQAKSAEQKELRLNRTPTKRFTLNMYSGDGSRRLSRRLGKKERIQYHGAE